MGHLILVRHSITAASASGRNLGQRTDPPLTAAGLRIAARLASTLAAELAELPHSQVRLVTSPALRCRQTVASVVEGIGHDATGVEVADGLLEIDYGEWDGLTSPECHARDPERRAAWESDPFATACPNGESGADVEERSTSVLGPIESWLTQESGRVAIVVAHNHVNRLHLCRLFGWPMRAYRDRLALDPAGYSLVAFGSGPPVIRRVNAAPA